MAARFWQVFGMIALLRTCLSVNLMAANVEVYGAGGSATHLALSIGPGWPACRVYRDLSHGVFADLGGAPLNLTWKIPDPGLGCTVHLRQLAPVDDPVCGNPIGIFSHATTVNIMTPDTVTLLFACGAGDNFDAVRKRSLPVDHMLPSNTPFVERLPQTYHLKASSKIKRGSDCKYQPKGDRYTTIGETSLMSQDTTTCSNANCQISVTNSVTTTTTTTFTVGESTTVELFDLIDQQVSFEYSHASAKANTAQLSETFTLSTGQTGHVTFTPKLACTHGSFSGSKCAKLGIATDVVGTTCVPLYLSDGKTPQGFWNFVHVS